jgi:hypothetical protein
LIFCTFDQIRLLLIYGQIRLFLANVLSIALIHNLLVYVWSIGIKDFTQLWSHIKDP